MSIETNSKLDSVKDALQKFDTVVNQNTFNDDEHIKHSIHLNSDRPSRIDYTGPDGHFTVRLDPKKGQATAKATFVTGDFRSTVTEESCTRKGEDPVYHHLWGIFHKAFNQD